MRKKTFKSQFCFSTRDRGELNFELSLDVNCGFYQARTGPTTKFRIPSEVLYEEYLDNTIIVRQTRVST